MGQELMHLKFHFLQNSYIWKQYKRAAHVKGDIRSAASLCNLTLVLRGLRRGPVRNNFWKIAELCCWCSLWWCYHHKVYWCVSAAREEHTTPEPSAPISWHMPEHRTQTEEEKPQLPGICPCLASDTWWASLVFAGRQVICCRSQVSETGTAICRGNSPGIPTSCFVACFFYFLFLIC